MKSNEFPVADLRHESLEKLQQLEKALREETGEEIVLIAYSHQKK